VRPRPITIVTACAALLLALPLGGCATPTPSKESFEQGAARYTFEIKAEHSDRPGVVWCSGRVTDLETKRTMDTGRFEIRNGEDGKATADDPKSGARLEVVVRVDTEGRTASYGASVFKGRTLVASQRDRINVFP
jgi:hypothetical protein